MLINTSDDMYWKVDNKVFYNKILAIAESKSTKKPIQFHFYDNHLNKNWEDLTGILSWDDILKQRCLELREKHSYIRLWYSGGRDSHLILKAFTDNNIVVDEVTVLDYNYKDAEYKHIIKYLKKNKHLYPTVKKITSVQFDLNMMQTVFAKNWETSARATNWLPIPPISEICNHNFKHGCNVTGIEKPRVYFDNGKIYSTMYDVTVLSWIGCDNHEPFYVSNNVPIYQYQTWHLVHYLKNNPEIIAMSDSDLNKNLFAAPANLLDFTSLYYKAAEGALRTEYADLIMGVPYAKKAFSDGLKSMQYLDIERCWEDHYPEIYKSFNNGIINVTEDHREYFREDNVTVPTAISSKMRYIDEKVYLPGCA